MKENIKIDYLKFLFYKTQTNLSRYQISTPDYELIKNLFNRLNHSENLAAELYILFNITEFKNLSKYLIYIFKKMEDDVINFDNLQQNLHSDSEYIKNEILVYLSNPMRKEIPDLKYTEEKTNKGSDNVKKNLQSYDELKEEEKLSTEELSEEKEDEPESEVSKFRENYLELIKSEESDTEIVFELPEAGTEKYPSDETETMDSAFDLPDIEDELNPNEESEADEKLNIVQEEIKDSNETDTENEQTAGQPEEVFGSKEIRTENEGTLGFEEDKHPESELPAEENTAEEKIQLSEEIQEELNLFKDSDGEIEEEDGTEEQQPANALFIEYENEIREKNVFLETEFDQMIGILNQSESDEEVRSKKISNIIETSNYLETISRNMSLEIISNIYQTITLSFEKISESRYDISESTLKLFKKGLILVLSLIKGDDYYGYKEILKSIENIRNALIEEKQKRETYQKRLQEKLEIENNLNRKYPNEIEKEKITILKQIIKNTEHNFNALEKISGEYQIYEALRGLSGNLNNFKDIVKLSKELQMKKLIQLAEAGYIFLKFLQNYRINPVTIETTEIFNYIIYNLKSLVVGKTVEDIDVFISYLNDPVKIYSKTNKKKT